MFTWLARTQQSKKHSLKRKQEAIELKTRVATQILETHQTNVEIDERRKMARRMTLDRRVYGF